LGWALEDPSAETKFTVTCIISEFILYKSEDDVNVLLDVLVNDAKVSIPIVKTEFNKVIKIMQYFRENRKESKYPIELIKSSVYL